MVDNTKLSIMSDKAKINAINEAAETQTDEIIKKINDCSLGNFDKMRTRTPLGSIIYKLYKWARQTKHFRLLDRCIGCGICVKQCPINAIELKDNKIAWTKSECVMCLGCLHHCPQFAIRYLWISEKHGQYLYQEKQ
jgi:ferredoxin